MTARRRLAALGTATALATVLAVAPSDARRLRDRTERVAPPTPDAATNRPAVSGAGRHVAFDSAATNLGTDDNGDLRDVFVRDLNSRRLRLVSTVAGGTGGGDGNSFDPAVSTDGQTVAFSSLASDLVADDSNEFPDVFVQGPDGVTTLVSGAPAGAPADSLALQPDIDAAGRRVVFTSLSTNLTPDATGGQANVFVRDLETGETTLVSRGPYGSGPNGRSSTPAISPDGRYVVFESAATNLVARDGNGVADVFLADLERGTLQRVSVNRRGRAQNKAVIAPFKTNADVSRDGRFVVWDSDATNLVRRDRNRDTDVFVRDVRAKTTRRVSLTLTGGEGNNDSINPRITPDGRYVSFDSFAENLFPGDAKGEDAYVRDRRLRTTSLMTVTSRGPRREPETKRQLLQRPSMSDDARVVGLTSTARLVPGEGGRTEDAYVRYTVPPRARIRFRGTRYRFRGDDPVTTVFRCTIVQLRVTRTLCPPRFDLSILKLRRATLRVRAMGPGTLMGPPTRKSSKLR